MAKVASRVALLAACFSLILPAAGWAGSSQAALAVSAMVPARCALRVSADAQPVMKCTRGSLPAGDPTSARRASSVEPRITREIVQSSMPSVVPAPRPLTDPGLAGDGLVSSLMVTVNF
jgi:hypothetical protein